MEIKFGSIGKNCHISNKASFYGAEHIFIGDNTRIDDFVIISAEEPVIIGSYVHIAPFCGLYGKYGIEMQDFSGLSSGVALYSNSDDYSGNSLTNPTTPENLKITKKGKIVLKRHVIIGVNSVIMPNVIIGEGSAVGAFSFVKKDIPEHVIAAGIPAKIISKRSLKIFELEKKL